jgi:hypothetical protein
MTHPSPPPRPPHTSRPAGAGAGPLPELKPPPPSPAEVGQIERLLERQHALFRQLDGMSQRQSILISDGQTEALLEVLAARQRVIDGIAETNAFLEPYRPRWDVVMNGLDSALRARLRARIEAMAALADTVAKRDEADRLELERRRNDLAVELTQVNRGRGAAAAYAPSSPPTPNFRDEEA